MRLKVGRNEKWLRNKHTGGHSNNSLGDRAFQGSLSSLLQLLQDERTNLLGRIMTTEGIGQPGVAMVGRNDLEWHKLGLFFHDGVIKLST